MATYKIIDYQGDVIATSASGFEFTPVARDTYTGIPGPPLHFYGYGFQTSKGYVFSDAVGRADAPAGTVLKTSGSVYDAGRRDYSGYYFNGASVVGSVKYYCSVSAYADEGSGSFSGTGDYEQGTQSVAVTATPANGYLCTFFAGTTYTNRATGKKTYTIPSVTGDISLAATFKKYAGITLKANNPADGGSVKNMPASPTRKFIAGDSYTFPAKTPTCDGYSFLGWSENASATTADYQPSDTYTFPSDSDPSNTQFYAVWTTTPTLTYNAQGGSPTPQPVTTYGSVSLDQSTITRSGYSRKGGNGAWFASTSGGSQLANPYNLTSDTTVYAQWTAFSTTYKYNYIGCPADTTGTAVHNAPNPTRTGYTFAGWYANSAGTGSMVCAGGASHTASDDTLYAQWTAKQYKVTLGKNDGTGGDDYVMATYGQAMPSATAPTRTGYTFGGYYDTLAVGGTQYYDAQMQSAHNWDRAGEGLALYAKWTANQYRVDFGKNGGTGGDDYVTATYNAAMPTPRTAPTRTGYTFGGYWDTVKDGGKQYYSGSMESVRAWDKTSATTLWAKWTAHTYTVKFYANGGAGTIPDQSFTYGVAQNLTARPGNFSRIGYSFGGWATSAGGTKEYDDGQSVSNLTATDNATVNLYAYWVPNTVYIEFNLNGCGTRDYQTTTYGTAAEVTAPTRTNYIFRGWKFSSCASGAKWGKTDDPSTTITNNSTTAVGDTASASIWVKNLRATTESYVTMTAQWERIKYTITATNTSMRSNLKITGEGVDDLTLAKATPSATQSRTFTALAGATYTATATMESATMKSNYTAGAWQYPVSFGGYAMERIAGTANTPAVFECSHEFGESEESAQLWSTDMRTVTVQLSDNPSDNPLNEQLNNLRPAMQFNDGTTTNVRVTAAESAGSQFLSWSYNSSAVSPVSVSGATIVVPTSSNVTLTANYKRRPQAVSASVHSATLAAVSELTANVTAGESSDEAITNIGYGLPATWKLSGEIPDGYEFDGWYDANGVRMSTSQTYTVQSVTTPTSLNARLRAKLTFRVKTNDGTLDPGSVSGNVAVDEGEQILEYPYEAYFTLGSTISIHAIRNNDDSHFSGWFLGVQRQGASRLAGYAADAEHVVTASEDILAYFTSSADVFYVALYWKGLASGFSLGFATSQGEVVELGSAANYKDASGFNAATGYGGSKFYEVTGIRRVVASVSGDGTKPVAKRIRRGTPKNTSASAGTVYNPVEIASATPFSAVIDANCCFVVDFSGASTRDVVAGIYPHDTGPDGGVVRLVDAISIKSSTEASETGVYEIGSKVVAVAIPDNGYVLEGWYDVVTEGGARMTTSTRYEFILQNFPGLPKNIYAKFVRGSFALYKWEGSELRKQLRWKSKVYELSKPANLTSVRVDATTLNPGQPAYPLARFKYESFSSPNAQAPSTGVVDFAVGEKDRRLQSQDMRRLPYITPEGRHIRPERYFQVEVENAAEVDAIIIGTSGEGLAT